MEVVGDRPVRVRPVLVQRAGDERPPDPRRRPGRALDRRPVHRPSATPRSQPRSRSPTSRSPSTSTTTRTGAGSRRRPRPAARSTRRSRSRPARPPGMYEGAIVASKGGHDTAIPVSLTVAVDAPQDAAGNFTGSMTFGGAGVAAAQANLPYNNGSVFGANDWNWRAESGDWRFFYFDVPVEPASGSHFLVETTWEDDAPYTDLDTLIFGRGENHYQLAGDGPFGAPYILDTVGEEPEHQPRRPASGPSTPPPAAPSDVVTGAGPGGAPRGWPSTRSAGTAASSTYRSRRPSGRRNGQPGRGLDQQPCGHGQLRRDVQGGDRPRRPRGRGVRPQPAGRRRPRPLIRTIPAIRRRPA